MLNNCERAPKWKLFSAVLRAASYHGVCEHLCVYAGKERGEGKWGEGERGDNEREISDFTHTDLFSFSLDSEGSLLSVQCSLRQL